MIAAGNEIIISKSGANGFNVTRTAINVIILIMLLIAENVELKI